MSIFAIFAAALSATAPVAQDAKMVTIIADTRHICGQGRVADDQRLQVYREAKAVAREQRALGKNVRIVKADGLVTVSPAHQIRVTRAGC